ncbi:hypothetical protein WEN_01320 [Mycoplasma wenyonii str. Massachusetts]|uniref:Uncharacterized protein n=1 Tax=Mycoplasma wenyonii (strain Massachusetts) TaxID=1197325 RepID=I6Z660_MYCWM|nr:hypothetical protein [Mycoplasma wenyonii]AFN65063.1 hypothetical protein WEN_01320 [Mycoplasma wenyonii str. Massachusetts]
MAFFKLLGTIFSIIGGSAGPLIYYGKPFVKPLKNRKVDWTFGWEEQEYKYENRNKYLYQGVDLSTICNESLDKLEPIYKLIFVGGEGQKDGNIQDGRDKIQGSVGLMKLKVKNGGYSPKWESSQALLGDKLNGVKLIIVQTDRSLHWIAAIEEGNVKGNLGKIEQNLETSDWNEITASETKKILREKIERLEIEREVKHQLKTQGRGWKCEIDRTGNLKNVYESFGKLTLENKKYKVLDVVSFGKNEWEKIGGGNVRGTVWYKHKWEAKDINGNARVLIIDMNKAVITHEGIGDKEEIALRWGVTLSTTISSELQQ